MVVVVIVALGNLFSASRETTEPCELSVGELTADILVFLFLPRNLGLELTKQEVLESDLRTAVVVMLGVARPTTEARFGELKAREVMSELGARLEVKMEAPEVPECKTEVLELDDPKPEVELLDSDATPESELETSEKPDSDPDTRTLGRN